MTGDRTVRPDASTREGRAVGALLLVALIWGLTFPVIKGVLADVAPLAFLALRFPLALLLLWPLLKWRIPARDSFRPGFILAALLGASFYLQVLGLQHTTPTRSAFITGMSVILVPLLYPMLTRKAPGWLPGLGAGLAAGGLFLITDPGGGGVNRGDVLTALCAVVYAVYIIVLEVATKRHPFEDLLVLQFLPLAVAFLPGAVIEGGPVPWGSGLLWGLAVTGPILAYTLYLQNRFQRFTTATRAAVIFASEPLFAAGFSFLLVGETLNAGQWVGGGLILAGILTAGGRT